MCTSSKVGFSNDQYPEKEKTDIYTKNPFRVNLTILRYAYMVWVNKNSFGLWPKLFSEPNQASLPYFCFSQEVFAKIA
jgi:hypothetical protein